MPKGEYGAKDLAVLGGLDAVRKRLGTYIGIIDSWGLMHCLWEIIGNSVNEALAGLCNDIVVTLHTDGSTEVVDNGRDIPVDKESKTGLPGAEVILTKLYAGVKFGNSSYNAVDGPHGVGSSVVNAPSPRLDVGVDRDGKTHHITFHQGHPGAYTDADPASPPPDSPFKRTRKDRPTELEIIGKISPETTGTHIRYWYDPEIFSKTAEFSYEQLIDHVHQTSFLVPGLKIIIIDENAPEMAATSTVEATDDTTVEPAQDQAPALDISSNDAELFDDSVESQSDDVESPAEEDFSPTVGDRVVDDAFGEQPAHPRVVEFLHTGGVKDFVDFLSKGKPISNIRHIQGEGTYKEEAQAVDEGGELHAQEIERTYGVDIALRWVNGYDTTVMSFVDIVGTPGGDTHVDDFMNAITKQIRKAVEDNARKLKVNMKDSAMKVERDDIQAGLVAVATTRVAEPQLQGQTKDVLGTAQVRSIVTQLTGKQFGETITGSKCGYKKQSSRVLEKIVGEMHARVQSRKVRGVIRRKNAPESALMPTRLSDCQPGNDDVAELFIVEGDSALGTAKAVRNAGFQALLPIRGKVLSVQKASITQMLSNKECAAIVQVVGASSGQSFDIEQSHYRKIIVMIDADVDGAHIRIPLLTPFYRYMQPLIEYGHVYAAVPPLHRIALIGLHKGEYVYTYSDGELAGKLADLNEKHIGYNNDIQQYKGLGEMDADQLADITMDPRTRMLRRIRMGGAAQASGIFSLSMGDDIPPHKQFIINNADDFDRFKIDT